MTEQATLDDRSDLTDSGEQPNACGDSAAMELDPELLSFIHGAQRLLEEAEARLRSGAVLPALSSLAAVPPLHGMVMGRCSEVRDPAEIDGEADIPNGLYL